MSSSLQESQSPYTTEIQKQVIGLDADRPAQILISQREYLVLRNEVGFWRAMHGKATLRESKLKQTVKELEGQVRDLRNRLFGSKSEKKNARKDGDKSGSSDPGRPRGQQPGSKGHGRTDRPDLAYREESAGFAQVPVCPECGEAYLPDGSKETEIIEVEVKAYTRRISRCCMRRFCSCKGVANTIMAPMPPKLMPNSPYGISVWEAVLLTKFHYCQPTNRLLNQYGELGLPISPGTVAGGLKRLRKLFQPVYDALYSHQMTEDRFHNDESGWKVFEGIDGKVGNRWWLWVSRSASVVFFQIAPGRGTDVPAGHFGNIEHQQIIVVCDRYSAYKSLAKQLAFIVLAFCWAHVRRDFLDAGRKFPDMEQWSLSWVEKIGELYHINNLRLKQFDQKLPIQQQPAPFKEQHDKLVEKMDAMAQERDVFIETQDPDSDLLSEVKYKILISLQNHWKGLSVFVDHPEVPMDNNKAERSIRNPVTGRKNFYGSASLWSSQLAAMMFSIFQTMALCGLNCNHWLRSYLTACAENHGNAPDDLSTFLPWKMNEDQWHHLSRPPDTS